MKNRVAFTIIIVLWILSGVAWSNQKERYERQAAALIAEKTTVEEQLYKIYGLTLECVDQRDKARECCEQNRDQSIFKSLSAASASSAPLR
jgi:hypothetical protein